MAKLAVRQQGQYYSIYLPSGIQIGLIFLGADGQYTKDVMTLKPIIKALAIRWGVAPERHG